MKRVTDFAGVEARYTDPVTGRALIPASTVRGWADQNRDGFADRCVIRLPGKRLIDLAALDEWLEDRRGRAERPEVDDDTVIPRRRELPPFEEVWAKSCR